MNSFLRVRIRPLTWRRDYHAMLRSLGFGRRTSVSTRLRAVRKLLARAKTEDLRKEIEQFSRELESYRAEKARAAKAFAKRRAERKACRRCTRNEQVAEGLRQIRARQEQAKRLVPREDPFVLWGEFMSQAERMSEKPRV